MKEFVRLAATRNYYLRAVITKFPYIHGVMDNRDYDLSTVPSGLE